MVLGELIFNQTMKNQSDGVLLNAILGLDRSIKKLIDITPEPIVLLRSAGANLSSNVADAVLILESAPCPANTRIVIEDWNINFTTTAGTIRAVILDASGNLINNVLRDVNSSVNGTGKGVLETGDRLALLGQTAGAGVFGCYFSGTKQKVR